MTFTRIAQLLMQQTAKIKVGELADLMELGESVELVDSTGVIHKVTDTHWNDKHTKLYIYAENEKCLISLFENMYVVADFRKEKMIFIDIEQHTKIIINTY